MITLASHVFEYFLCFFIRACVLCAFLASLGSHGVTPPPFLPTLTFSSRAVPLWGFLGFFGVRQSNSCVGVDRQDDYSTDSSASLAQCGFVGGFFPNFAIFTLVSDHLRNFSFYSWASLLVLPFLLRLPGGFFPNFAIFALVSDHLRNFSFYSWASLLVLPFLLRLPILLSLSPRVTSLGGFTCRPLSLMVTVFVFWRFFFL